MEFKHLETTAWKRSNVKIFHLHDNAWLLISVVIANFFARVFRVLQAHAIFMNDPCACGAFPCIPFVVEDIEPVDLVLSSPCEAAAKQGRPHEVGSELERVALSKWKDMDS